MQEIAYDIQPGDNTPAPVKTLVRIGYTTDALYVELQEHRTRIRRRFARTCATASSAFSDDWVGVFLDTFDDQRRGYELLANPLGVQSDLINDATTGERRRRAGTACGGSAGRITADGYEVEMRIPFSTLRFRNGWRRQALGHLAVPQLAARQAPPAGQPQGAARIQLLPVRMGKVREAWPACSRAVTWKWCPP